MAATVNDARDLLILRESVPVASAWRHQRTGGVYIVMGYCRIEATARPAVLYASVKGDTDMPWARDAEEFTDGRFRRVMAMTDGTWGDWPDA